MDVLTLTLLAFVSSTITAVIGVGGGLLLIAMLPGFLPASALVPLHGVVQLASNASRAAFGWKDVRRPIVGLYAVGAVVGAGAGYVAVPRVRPDLGVLALGVFILLATWLPRRRETDRGAGEGAQGLRGVFVPLGIVQTFVSLFVGAAGPLSPPVLLRAGLPRDELVATHAGLMTVMHSIKIATFGVLGFAFAPYATLLGGMIVGVIAGSWVGTRLRKFIPAERFRFALRLVLTLLALRMLVGWGLMA